VHRAAYTLWAGKIHEGFQVLHVCGNSACCNPDHLAVATAQETAALRAQHDKRAKGQSVTTFPDAHIGA
jgi:hypothetical protein